MPSLGATYGRGAATMPQWDLANSDYGLGSHGEDWVACVSESNRVEQWGPEWDHDWPTWRHMLPLYLDRLTGGGR